MEKKFTQKHVAPRLLQYLGVLLLFLCWKGVRAQTTISSAGALSNEGNAGIVTFNFQNTNGFPVIITGLEGIVRSYGGNTVELWYKNTAISGPPGAITPANGWTSYGNNSIAGIANLLGNETQPFFTTMSLSVPAGTTYGFALVAYSGSNGNLRVDTSASATVLSGGGCNLILGTGAGYGSPLMPPEAPSQPNRGWIGKLTFMSGANCTGAPNTAVVSGPAAICANALFTLSASGYSVGAGISHQWQVYNTATSTWDNIPGATAASYTSTGITTPTQYRFRSTCGSTSAQSTSNALTVNIGTALASGVYTINKTLPSTSTNFTSFNAAAAAMKCGITGPVTLNVVPGSGPYTEAVVFGNIPGTSPSSRIRLNGNGVVLQYESSNTQQAILGLQSTKYMTIDSVTVRSLATNYGIGIALYDTAKRDSVIRCFVDMRSLNLNNAATAGISMSNNFFNTSNYWGNAALCYIGRNHILGTDGEGGPFYGIIDGYNYVGNPNYQPDSGNIVAYNNIENFGYYGVLSGSYNGTKILYNNIHRTNKQSAYNFFGIRTWGGYYNTQNAYTARVDIIGNRIHDPGITSQSTATVFYGIMNDNNWSGTNQEQYNTLIANNAIYNVGQNVNSIYGLWFGDNYNNNMTQQDTTWVYHNTVDIAANVAGNGVTYGLWSADYVFNNNNNNYIFVRNNMVTLTGGTTGAKAGFAYNGNNNQSNNNIIVAQRNNIYVNSAQAGTQNYGMYGTVGYPTMAAFQAAYPSQEIGSLSVDPLYTDPGNGDLTPLNYALYGNGQNLQALVPRDILGRPRSTSPTPGAFEIATDAGVSALLSPSGTYCSSVKEVRVRIVNAGVIAINNVQVNWSLNNVLQSPVSWTGSLPGAGNANNTTIVSLGNGLFMPNTPVTIKVWTSMPNGQVDPLPYNDTLVVTTQSSTSVPVNLGPDLAICTGNTHTLDAGYPGATYVWDNFTSGQTRTVSAAGTYYVRLTALDGCIGVDTFVLSLRPLPVVNLGPDREICWGETTTFDAGHPGSSYLWDDGSAGQTRTVDTSGYYEVQVTDIYGCMGFDNITVGMKDIPGADGINATHADSGTYSFYPINPVYSSRYSWDFGDGSPQADGYFVQHTYTALGIYTVTLFLEGECTGLIIDKSRTVDVFSIYGGGTGIDGRNGDGDIVLFPNPARDQVSLRNQASGKMKRVMVYNAIGQLVADQKADSPTGHSVYTGGLADGIYTIRIETDKGYVTRKFEVLH